MRSAARLVFHPRLPYPSHLPPFFILAPVFLFYSFFFTPSFLLFLFSLSLSRPLAISGFTASYLPLSLSPSPTSLPRLSLSRRPPKAHLPWASSHCISNLPPALIVRYCPSFQCYRQTLSTSSADRASWGAGRALTLAQHGFGSVFGLKEIGSKCSLFGLCALVLQSPVISVVTAVQWAEWQWEKKLVGSAPPPSTTGHANRPTCQPRFLFLLPNCCQI